MSPTINILYLQLRLPGDESANTSTGPAGSLSGWFRIHVVEIQ